MEPTRGIYPTTDRNSAQDDSIAEELYEFLKAHTNYVWGSGVEVFDRKLGCLHPVHRNHRQDLIHKFVLGQKVGPSVLTLKDVQRHLAGTGKYYFTGSKAADYALIYLDADCHLPWQDDPDEAEALLKQVMPHLYVCGSARGRNGYVLLNRRSGGWFVSAQNLNQALCLLEMSLRKLFLFNGIKTTIEVKGHIQHVRRASYYCGKLGKVPNYDGITAEQLQALKSTCRISIRTIKNFAQQTNRITGISDDVVRFYYRATKVDKARQPSLENLLPKPAKVIAVAGNRPTAEKAGPDISDNRPRDKRSRNKVVGRCVGGDSFDRGKTVCYELARNLRRVPSVDEVLTYLRDTGLHTGAWEENEEKRRGRIAYNLDWVRKSFDPKKCGGRRFNLDLSEYLGWVDHHYPKGIGSTTPEEVSVFLVITKFCVVLDRNEDKTLPYKRFRACWERLYEDKLVKRQFRWNRFHEITNQLRLDGVIVISGKVACRKALIWDLGPHFPPHLMPDMQDGELAGTTSRPETEEEKKEERMNLILCLQQQEALFRQQEKEAIEIIEAARAEHWKE